jgi:hypothetical protein
VLYQLSYCGLPPVIAGQSGHFKQQLLSLVMAGLVPAIHV